MKKNSLSVIIICVLAAGIFILTMTSCKRNKESTPGVIPNAGFRIALSGTADKSTLYVPETLPEVTSRITVRALNSDGSPAQNFDVIFREGFYGYFDDFKASVVKNTGGDGRTEAIFKIPPGVTVKAEVYTNVIVTLVDDGRLDSILSPVEDVIPIRIIPYLTQGIIIHGHITTPAGNGVEGVLVELDGEIGLADGVTVTRPSGSYEFYVAAGWYGTITPSSSAYTFTPGNYSFDVSAPIVIDIYDLDFVAIFSGGDTLAVDVTQWKPVPVEGGTQVVNVYNSTGEASIGYFIIPDVNWLHVSPNSGTTPGSFTITADENTTGEDRTGTILINSTDTAVISATVSITQEGNQVPSDARLAVDPETINLNWDSGSSPVTVQVFNSTTSDDSISFYVTTIPENDWLSPSAISGVTPTTLNITGANNLGPARTGQVILTPTTTGVSNTVTITVNQEAGPSLALNIETRNVAVTGDVFSVNVTNPTTNESIPFTVTSNNPPMIGAGGITPTSGNTPAGVTIIVNNNATGLVRTAVVTFTGTIPNIPAAEQPTVTLTITQQGS